MGLFDRILTKVEQVGFVSANAIHKVVVTGVVVASAYGFYALGRDYRDYFKLRRDPRYKEYLDQREEVLRELLKVDAKSETPKN